MRIDANARIWNILGLMVFACMSAAIFWDVLPWFLAPLAPDATPLYPLGNRTVTMENLIATGGESSPYLLYWLIFPPLLANKLTYVVDTLVLVLAGVYYLRGRGTGYPAAWLGGLALGFCGYTFTLFSAGHRGYFSMMCCAVFSFGLLVRCFRGRRWFHFAMLGACLAWGIPNQADVLMFVGLLVAAFALWLTFSRRADPATPPLRRMAQVWPRFVVTLVVAGVIGVPGVRYVMTELVVGRKEQMASASSPVTTDDAAAKKREKWIFATNWSLPPADMAEFIVPGIFGNDSFQPPYPYWGALGRPFGWKPGYRVMPNYRQHTLYLGALTVCFALFAVLLWWRKRRRGDASADGIPESPLVDVPFWLGAGVLCLLLAMGRYTPFYRLFYSLPYMDLVRCPVKFHHLVEICIAFLCGLGVEMWWRGAVVPAPAKRDAAAEIPPVAHVGRWLTCLAVGMAVVLLIAAGVMAGSRSAVAQYISSLGLGAYAEGLAGYAVRNLIRAACVFGVAALLFGLGRPRPGRNRPAVWLLAMLALMLATDLATVSRRFVHPIDLRPYYDSHVVSATAAQRGGIGARIANYATTRGALGDWFAQSLSWSGLEPALDTNPKSKMAPVMRALFNRPEALWRTTHARFVVLPWKAAAPMVKGQVLVPLVSFSIGEGTVQEAQPSPDSWMLAEFAGALPPTYVVESWQGGLNEEAQVQRMNGLDWDPARVTLCSAPGGTGEESRVIGEAQVVRRRGSDFRLTTKVEVNTPQAGLLLLDDKYADDLQADLDGQEVPVHLANALWAAVKVPAGRHVVGIRRAWKPVLTLLSAVTGLAVAMWGVVGCLKRRGT